MNTKPEFVENLNDCTLHYGVDMSSLRFDPPYGQKIGLGMGEKIVRACNSHDDLVAALERLMWLETSQGVSDDEFEAAHEAASVALAKAKN